MEQIPIVYFFNCRNREHAQLFKGDAFYDLNVFGHEANEALGLLKGQSCVVARYADRAKTLVRFDWHSFERECSEIDPEDGKTVRVIRGPLFYSETLKKSFAVNEPRYIQFFDKLGRFKQLTTLIRDLPKDCGPLGNPP